MGVGCSMFLQFESGLLATIIRLYTSCTFYALHSSSYGPIIKMIGEVDTTNVFNFFYWKI